MADNTQLPGTGTGTADIVVATDKIGGVDYQRVKISLGPDGTAVDAAVGSGATDATVLRVVHATDDPAVATLGATTGAAIITDADGTIQRYLRGIIKLAITAGGWLVNVAQINGVTPLMGAGNTGTGSPRVSIATDDVNLAAINAVSGTTAGAKVITDANGTIQQYLRGLIYQSITAGAFLVTAAISTGANLIGYVGRKNTYAAKATITWTGTSLANGSGRESTVIDNTSNRYADVRIRIQTKGQSSGTAYIDWYVYTALGDTTYTDAATGSDAAFTAANRKNSRYLGSTLLNAATSAVQGELLLSDVFATMPDKWGLIGINNSGATLSATAGDHVLEYQGIN